MRQRLATESAWFAVAAEHAARFGLVRSDDPVFVACDQFFLESAAAEVERRGERCWSRLDLPHFLEAIGAYENREVMTLALETLAAFYAWLVAEGELRLGQVAALLDQLAETLAPEPRPPPERRVRRTRDARGELGDGAQAMQVDLRRTRGRANVAA